MRTAPPAHAATAPWRLFDGYRPPEGVYDEMTAQAGSLRPHCERLVGALETIGRHELVARWDNARRAIRDNGVTYNVYGDPASVARPWALDMVPMVISAAEWSRLETALTQRTRLLNLIL